jgi:hypothetical protein
MQDAPNPAVLSGSDNAQSTIAADRQPQRTSPPDWIALRAAFESRHMRESTPEQDLHVGAPPTDRMSLQDEPTQQDGDETIEPQSSGLPNQPGSGRKIWEHGRTIYVDGAPTWSCLRCEENGSPATIAVWVLTSAGAKTYKLINRGEVWVFHNNRHATAHVLSEHGIVVGEETQPSSDVNGAAGAPENFMLAFESSEGDLSDSENYHAGQSASTDRVGRTCTPQRTSMIWSHGADQVIDDQLHWSCSYCECASDPTNASRSLLIERNSGRYSIRYWSRGSRMAFKEYGRAKSHLLKAHDIAEDSEILDGETTVSEQEQMKGDVSDDDTNDEAQAVTGTDGLNSDDEDELLDTAGGTVVRKAGGKSSFIWEHATEKMLDGCPRWACNHCQFMHYPSTL